MPNTLHHILTPMPPACQLCTCSYLKPGSAVSYGGRCHAHRMASPAATYYCQLSWVRPTMPVLSSLARFGANMKQAVANNTLLVISSAGTLGSKEIVKFTINNSTLFQEMRRFQFRPQRFPHTCIPARHTVPDCGCPHA